MEEEKGKVINMEEYKKKKEEEKEKEIEQIKFNL